LSIAREWHHQRELAADPTQAASEEAMKLAIYRMMEAHGRPGAPLSEAEGLRILRESQQDAQRKVTAQPPPQVDELPINEIAAALAHIGDPAIGAMDRYLKIKLNPAVGAVIIASAELMQGEKAMQVLKRVASGYADEELKKAATRVMNRLRTSTPPSDQSRDTSPLQKEAKVQKYPTRVIACSNPDCRQQLRVPIHDRPLEIRCPKCGWKWMLPPDPLETKADRLEEARNDQEFFDRLKLGPCAIQIPIAKVPDFYERILHHLSPGEIGRMSKELHGVCPKCCFWMDCATLAQPLMTRQFVGTLVPDGGGLERLLSGRCPNGDCPSRDILLTWKGPTEIVRHIDSHLKRVQDSMGSEGMQAVEQLGRAEATAYVADVIYVLWKKSPLSGHRYCAQKTRNGDQGICVSVIPGNRQDEHVRKQAFPQGCPSFFFEMVRHFGWESGDVAVAHWIYWNDSSGTEVLDLGYVGARMNADRPGAKILPIELLTETEREEFGL
jgi:hypothetical protein